MFTLSPSGYVLIYDQMSPLGLIGRESQPVTITSNLTGQVFSSKTSEKYDLSMMSGDKGSVDGIIEAGTPGTLRPVFEIQGGADCPNAYIKAWLDSSNKFFAEITDASGSVVATSLAASGSLPSGFGVTFRLVWSCAGNLPDILMTNFGGAYVNVDGTRPDWSVSSNTWDPWRPGMIHVGAFSGSSTAFNGKIRHISVSVSANPDATLKTWSLPPESPPPTLTSASITHLGDLAVVGTDLLSKPGRTTNVRLTGTGATYVVQASILGEGGHIGPETITVPAITIPGINDTTDCVVIANGFDSNSVTCSLPSDEPTISSATIGFDESLNLTGTNFLSRVPDVSSIEVTAPGAVTLTRSQVLTGGGTWTDVSISIPASLVPGIDDTSTCAVTSNAQTTASHAIYWPAPAPAVSSASIAHLGELTISGTDMLSTSPASNSVIITGDGAVTLTKAQILSDEGTFTATSIIIPASLVPGVTDSSSVKIHANLQDSNVESCSLPSDEPTITGAEIQPTSLDLVVDGINFLSRTPDVSSIDITTPGAVTLTQSDVETGGGTWTDVSISIPGSLVPGIDDTSTCAVTSNSQTSSYSSITGP